MKNSSEKTTKGLTAAEIEAVFRETKPAEKLFSPIPSPKTEDSSDNWIITSGSSKQNNKLIEVSTWQIGQVY